MGLIRYDSAEGKRRKAATLRAEADRLIIEAIELEMAAIEQETADEGPSRLEDIRDELLGFDESIGRDTDADG